MSKVHLFVTLNLTQTFETPRTGKTNIINTPPQLSKLYKYPIAFQSGFAKNLTSYNPNSKNLTSYNLNSQNRTIHPLAILKVILKVVHGCGTWPYTIILSLHVSLIFLPPLSHVLLPKFARSHHPSGLTNLLLGLLPHR